MENEIIRITTDVKGGSGKGIDLVLTKTKVSMELSAGIREEVQKELAEEREKEKKDGLIGKLVGAVLGGVEKVMQQRIEFDLREVDGVAYEGGKLVFAYKKKRLLDFESVNLTLSDGKPRPALACFAEADARRFVEELGKAQAAYDTFLHSAT